MPLVLHLETDEGSNLGLWHMQETVEELKGLQPDQKSGPAGAEASHALRMKQQLCTKILLGILAPSGPLEMTKDLAGRPWPVNRPGFLSISHNREYVALLYNPTRPCGIDIEQPTERILRIANRFIHPEENEQIRPEHVVQDTTLIWCIKECMFKQIGRQGVVFRDELRVELPETSGGNPVRGEAFDVHQSPPLKILYRSMSLDNLILVHTIA